MLTYQPLQAHICTRKQTKKLHFVLILHTIIQHSLCFGPLSATQICTGTQNTFGANMYLSINRKSQSLSENNAVKTIAFSFLSNAQTTEPLKKDLTTGLCGLFSYIKHFFLSFLSCLCATLVFNFFLVAP